jgi:hypothetical protein
MGMKKSHEKSEILIGVCNKKVIQSRIEEVMKLMLSSKWQRKTHGTCPFLACSSSRGRPKTTRVWHGSSTESVELGVEKKLGFKPLKQTGP